MLGAGGNGRMTMDGEHYDDLETRDAEARERALMAALSGQVANAKDNGPAWAEILADVDAPAVTNRAALATLPVTRKSDLTELQASRPPFGGLTTKAAGELSWVFSSPGPIYEPGDRGGDFWRMGRALHAAGFRAGDIVHNTFAYHLTPAGHMMEAGAHACGCTVVPAGVGNTEQQIRAIADIRPDGYVGTPSFLRILLDKAAEAGLDASSMAKAAVGGEALPPSLRAEFTERGVAVLQSYGTADLGLVAYESPAQEGMIADEGVIIEIVRPGTGEPVPDGEVGEVVVTTLNPDYPLIRFATGDLSAVLAGASPCGRTNMRIKGWMGRADQTTKVKGMFVHPEQVAQVAARHAEIKKARLVVDNVDRVDVMTLHCEVAGAPGEDLKSAIAGTLQSVCKLKGQVAFAEPGSLANDGKVIEDARSYE